jgi:hypothetical protein
MKTYKHIVLLIFLVLTLVCLSVLLYKTYHYLATPQLTASMAMPNNAALIVKGKEVKHILDLQKENKHILPLLFSPAQEKKIKRILDNILPEDKDEQLIRYASLYLSVHVEGEEELLFVLETPKYYNELLVNFRDTLCHRFGGKSFLYRGNKIDALSMDDQRLYLNYQNGLLLMTFSEILMRRAMNKLILKDDYMQNIIDFFPNKRNENTDIQLYVQYRYFIPYLKNKMPYRDKDMAVIDMMKSFRWSIFDLDIEKKDILLSGYTTLDTLQDRSVLFIHKNNNLDFYKLLPVEANHIFSIRADCAEDFIGIKSEVQSTEDIFSLIYPNQILTFRLENDSTCYNYLLVKSENISEASLYLFNSVRNFFIDNYYRLDTLQIGSLLVGHVDVPNFVYTRLGINNHLPQLEYYTIIDEYIIFTNKEEAMLTYLGELRKNRTLKTAIAYQSLENYFPKEANLFYYKNTIQPMRIQFYAQSDTILLSNAVFRME